MIDNTQKQKINNQIFFLKVIHKNKKTKETLITKHPNSKIEVKRFISFSFYLIQNF